MAPEAPKILPGKNDHEKLQALSGLTYKQQAVWFLNAFWDTQAIQKDAERLWAYVHTCADLDAENHGDGSGLDEVNAHRFLEVYGETLTVRELRTKLRGTGALEENERPKVVPITHYLLFKYNVNWHELVNASQGDNSAEIAKAQKLLEEVQSAFKEADSTHKQAAASFNEAQSRANAAARSEATAKEAEAEALAKEAEARTQEAPFKAAQEEVEAALAEVHKQESEYNGKIADAEKRSEEGVVVSRNKAKAELEKLGAEDPLPLSRAKITLEAAYKRAEKTRAPFEAATKQAEAARAVASAAAADATAAKTAADRAKEAAERDKIAAEAALANARERVAEAEAYLQEIRSKPGSAHGALWWIDRELHEAKKYQPTSKGGIAK